MLPEPTLPKRAAADPAPPESAVMVPLFCVPDDPDPGAAPVPGRRGTRSSGRNRRSSALASPRPNPRGPAGRTGRAPRGAGTGTASAPGKEPADLLTVTAERLRRALARSFLRHGIPGDPEAAVHAAMNVVEPVLQARDTEILRLRRLMTDKLPGR
jgi:hypothetical protein